MPDPSIPPRHDRPGVPWGAPGIFLAAALALGASAAAEPIGRTVQVPLDHAVTDGARAPLYYELGAPFDARKPTVLVIADGQQFYVRRGAMEAMQKEEFGPAFNVVGIVGRGATPEFIAAARNKDGSTDWLRAWRLFNSRQWIGDIESVRIDLLGPNGKVLLYGASGGGMLAHEYLARHGDRVIRAFTACAVDPFAVDELGLVSDRFWDEIEARDKELRPMLLDLLERRKAERPTLIMTLQRQNFFVPPERIQDERAELIRALARGDEERVAAARKEYQVAEVSAFFEAPEGIPVRVREFEIFAPSGGEALVARADAVYPDLENQHNFAAPLLDLMRQGRVPMPSLDRAAAHRVRAPVFLLAGRWDHTVDYRAAIALASSYPRHVLFLADDDHMFAGLKQSGDRDALLQSFLLNGPDSPAFNKASTAAGPRRWTESRASGTSPVAVPASSPAAAPSR